MRIIDTQIPIIQGLRGFCALGICLYHFVSCTTDYIQTPWIINTFNLLSLNVEIFFVISSIVIPLSMIQNEYKYTHFGIFLKKRLIRVEFPFIASIFVAILYLNIRNFIPSSNPIDLSPSFLDTFLHFGYLIPFFENHNWINPVYWSLSVEFQYYLYIAITFPLALSSKPINRFIFYAVYILPIYFISNHNMFFSWSPFFLFGISYVLWKLKKINSYEAATIFTITSIVVFMEINAIHVVIAFLSISLIHFCAKYSNRWFNNLGNLSFSIYLLHSVTGAPLINLLSHYLKEPWQKFGVIISGVVFTLIAARLFYSIVELPSQMWSKKIKYNR